MARPFDDFSHSYLLGLYLGDGHVAPATHTANHAAGAR